MFEKLRRRSPLPLTGAPAVRRLKTYSAQSGYVYRYFYCGQRPYHQGPERGVEFVFDVSADRRGSMQVAVFASDDAVSGWQQKHGRGVTATERYAIAKMALFQAFDERPDPAAMAAPVCVRAADAEAILETLGLD
jgi:hypothetical protein